MIKRCLFTGFIILLPLILTLFFLNLIISVITSPFIGFFHQTFIHTEWMGISYETLIESELFLLFSKCIVLLVLCVFIIFIGSLGQTLLVNKLLFKTDLFLQSIPLINKIYCSVREVVNTLFTQNKENFSEAVLVPFPHSNVLSIGLVTGKGSELAHKDKKISKVLVFIPTAPNPTAGYLLMFNPNQLIPLNINVEDAMKFVISCGTTLNNKT